MRNATFGWQNWLSTAVLTAGSQAGDLGVGQIQNDQGSPSTAWQTAFGTLTPEAGAWMQAVLPAAQSWGAFSVGRTNLTGAAQLRWRVGGPDILAARTALATDTNAGATKGTATTRTGSVTGGTAYTNAAGSSFVRPGFVITKAGWLYEVALLMRRVSGTTTAGSAIIAEYLDSSGAVVRSSVPMTALAQNTSWQLLVGRWRPGRDGATTIYMAADTGTLQYELGAASFAMMPELDTGLISAGVQPGYAQSVYVPPAPVTGVVCRLDISDPTNPDGFVNIPLAYAGSAWTPARNIAWDSAAGADAEVDEVITRGGQEFPSMRFQRRRWEISHQAVLDAEVWPQLEEMLRTARRGGNVLFVPDPDSAQINRETVFGRLTSVSDRTYPFTTTELRAWRGKITERL